MSLTAAGISNLLQGSWPELLLLQLSVQGLGNKAYLLLRMTIGTNVASWHLVCDVLKYLTKNVIRSVTSLALG